MSLEYMPMSAIALLYCNCLVGFLRGSQVLSQSWCTFFVLSIVQTLHFVTLSILVTLVIDKYIILLFYIFIFTFPCWLMMFNIVCVHVFAYVHSLQWSVSHYLILNSKWIVCFTIECWEFFTYFRYKLFSK